MGCRLCVYRGEGLAAYGFGAGHPFGTDRHAAFVDELERRGLPQGACYREPVSAGVETLEWFHDHAYVERVRAQSVNGEGFLDYGDTPAFRGVYEAAATVVGSAVDAVERILDGECRRAFVPIAGLHHARRDGAAGFCVFNDCGVAIEALRRRGIQRVAYVDIDAHHGDGVYYGFVDDPQLCIVDLHEDGRFLYPGSGSVDESGDGPAAGTKLNVPLPPGADDYAFRHVWQAAETFVAAAEPEFILLQCGADSVDGDPLTHMRFSAEAHRQAASRLAALADRLCDGRMLALGGGGYDRANLAAAWCAVVEAMAA